MLKNSFKETFREFRWRGIQKDKGIELLDSWRFGKIIDVPEGGIEKWKLDAEWTDEWRKMLVSGSSSFKLAKGYIKLKNGKFNLRKIE